MSDWTTLPRTASAAAQWRPLRRFVGWEERVGSRASRHPLTVFLHELVRFGVKQAWACLFGALMLALLLGTHRWYPAHTALSRYDVLTIAAVLIQVGMLLTGLETRDEAKVILMFHITGTVMEVFKTAAGSWVYPEPSLLRLGGVPLFTGFMYAAVGSYLARAWCLFDLRFLRHPPLPAVLVLAAATYINFFSHHVLPDLRLILYAAAALLFGRSWVCYRIWRTHRRMPLLLGLVLIALFIWFAENIGTLAHAWVYPHQARQWSAVRPAKIGAWFLLTLISYAMIAVTNGIRMTRPLVLTAPVERRAWRPSFPDSGPAMPNAAVETARSAGVARSLFDAGCRLGIPCACMPFSSLHGASAQQTGSPPSVPRPACQLSGGGYAIKDPSSRTQKTGDGAPFPPRPATPCKSAPHRR